MSSKGRYKKKEASWYIVRYGYFTLKVCIVDLPLSFITHNYAIFWATLLVSLLVRGNEGAIECISMIQ